MTAENGQLCFKHTAKMAWIGIVTAFDQTGSRAVHRHDDVVREAQRCDRCISRR